jgi:hypothetical protein
MIRYDPDWRADGRPDKRKYPIYLIIVFWTAIAICALSPIILFVAWFLSYRTVAASSVFIFAAGLGIVAWTAAKAEKTSTR